MFLDEETTEEMPAAEGAEETSTETPADAEGAETTEEVA